MHDEFIEEVKRTIAARVGNICSNPQCNAVTSGPQDTPEKALNVGVAAHITGAAPAGPRYNASLSPKERRHPDNGIWLCQTCSKLVDNDVPQFPEQVLRAWKTLAEHRARSLIGRTTPVPAESQSQRKVREILLWKDKYVTLAQMNTGRDVALIGPVRGRSAVKLLDCTEFYVTIGNNDWSKSVSLSNIEISFDAANKCLELQERYF